MNKKTRHHVPPRHPDKRPKFLNEKTEWHHDAYHLLFGNAQKFKDAAKILKREWWDLGKRKKRKIQKDREWHEAYHNLFHNAKSFDDAAQILRHDWWNPHHPTVCDRNKDSNKN